MKAFHYLTLVGADLQDTPQTTPPTPPYLWPKRFQIWIRVQNILKRLGPDSESGTQTKTFQNILGMFHTCNCTFQAWKTPFEIVFNFNIDS